VTWVSIAGAAPSLAELLAGGVDIVACSLPEARALLEAGRIRSLGVMADERVAQFPTVPTLKEQGVDFSLGTLRGLAVPKDVPADRVRTLADAVQRVVNSPEYLQSLAQAGFTPAYEDPAQFAATLEGTDARLGALLQSEAFAGLAVKQLGPMFFPGVLAVALAAVVLGLVVTSRRAPAAAAGQQPPSGFGPGGAWRFAEPLLWIVAYIAAAESLGFVVTAGVLLLAYLLRLGTRPPVAVPLVLVLVPVAYQIFAVLLRVSLPRGILGW
jgi:hypothetical protein